MKWKHALIASFICHSVLLLFLSMGVNRSFKTLAKPLVPIEAHLVIKNKKNNKDLLPKKIETPAALPIQHEEQKDLAKKEPLAKAPQPAEKETLVKQDPKLAKKRDESTSYVSKLASLSDAFAKELETKDIVLPEQEVEDDANYFDQIYSLIKESFVVPPHLDGPKGQNLRAVLRIFLASDGTLNKLTLEEPSGDEHFDKAVMDGTKRVNNFGAVPIFLQNVLQERGLVVELCPVKCKEN